MYSCCPVFISVTQLNHWAGYETHLEAQSYVMWLLQCPVSYILHNFCAKIHTNIDKHCVRGNLTITGLIPGLRPANERWRYFVTKSLIGWAQDKKQPCTIMWADSDRTSMSAYAGVVGLVRSVNMLPVLVINETPAVIGQLWHEAATTGNTHQSQSRAQSVYIQWLADELWHLLFPW